MSVVIASHETMLAKCMKTTLFTETGRKIYRVCLKVQFSFHLNRFFTAARALAAAVMSLFCHNKNRNKPLNFSSFFFSFFRILNLFPLKALNQKPLHCLTFALHCLALALALLSISIAQHQHCLALAQHSISIAQHCIA